MTVFPTEHQLLRYLSGDLRGAEAEQVRAFIEASPERRGALAGLREALNTDLLAKGVSTPDDVALAQLLVKIDMVEQPRGMARSPGRRWYPLAMGLVSACLLVIGWTLASHRVETSLAAQQFSYATGPGERATITLPDGSTVLLNVASQLQVPTNYATGNRAVVLTGEAIFTVNNKTGTPFTVAAGPSTTRVLGTTFGVRHYATDTAASIVVHDGKVSVQSQVLVGAEQVFVSRHGVGPVRVANPGALSFASGVLTLNSMLLVDAVVELNRWYDVDIRFADAAVAQERISGGFRAGSIADLAEHLQLAFNLRAVRTGRVLTLHSR